MTDRTIKRLTETISKLTQEVRELRKKKNGCDCLKSQLLPATKYDLEKALRKIMATQAEVTAELRLLKEQAVKVRQEVVDAKTELAATIKRLEDIIAAGNTGEASAELVQVKDELKAEFQTLDDLHLDQVPPTPA